MQGVWQKEFKLTQKIYEVNDSVKPLAAKAESLKCIDFMQTCGGEMPIDVLVLNAIFFLLPLFLFMEPSIGDG